jgi:hypothetical protein
MIVAMIVIMMMMTTTKQEKQNKEELILESVCSLMCSLKLIKQDLDKMKENDHNEKHNGAVSSNYTPEQNRSNKTTVMITL